MQVIQEYILEYLNNHQVADESNDLADVSFLVRQVVVLLRHLVGVVLVRHLVVDLLVEQHQQVAFELVLMLLMNYLVIPLVFLMVLVHLVVSVVLLVVLVHSYDIDKVVEMGDVVDIDQVVVHDDHQVDILHMAVDSSYNHEMDDHHSDLVVVLLHELFRIDLVVSVLLHLETVPIHLVVPWEPILLPCLK